MDSSSTIKLVATLDKILSAQAIKKDLNSFKGHFFVEVIAKLNKKLSQTALKQSLKEITNLNVDVSAKMNTSATQEKLMQQVRDLQDKIGELEVRLKANTTQLDSMVKQAGNSAQKYAQQHPIEYGVSVRKDKLINDLALLAKQNSKLFTNTNATQKYGKLLDDAYGASSLTGVRELTVRMSAFKSELKATNLSGLTLADTFKKTVGRAGELVSATSVVMVAYSQARQAYKEVLQLDNAMTGLYKVADEIRSRDDFPAYLDKAIKKAKQLSVETTSLISSVTDWKKIGFGLGLSEELAEVSTKLEKTGDMSIDKATSTLISTLQAFKEIDGLTEEQYNERALAIADKINSISNTRSIDAEGISDALQNSVATLQEANNDLNQSIAMIAAGNKIFQSPSEVGNMLKVVSMRLRGVSEDGEQAEESVAKLRDTILNLTNGEVDIMLDENTFKSTYDILLEISKVYDSLSDKSQALLLEKIAGKQRGASTAALLQNMSEAEAIYQDALNSTGSVNKEFERYQESASASVTRFKETLVDTYTGILSGDMIRSVADTGSAVLDLVNKFNLLQSSIIGVAAVGTVKGITAIGVACVSSAKQMSMLGDAINRVNSLPAGGKKRENELRKIGEATRGLSDKQNKLLLSNKNLETSDRMNILAGQGVIKSKREEKLVTLGLAEATDTQTAANVKATASTFSLKAAVTGLGASMKAAFMSNPIGISLMALSVTIGAIAGQYREYRQQLEETRQKNIEAADSASAQVKKLEGLYNQYEKLASITDRTSEQETELKTVIEDITGTLGDKAKALEGLTIGTEEYTKALSEATKAELESQLATAIVGRKSAEENLHDATWSTWSGSEIDIPLNINMIGVDEHVKALDIVRDSLRDFERKTNDGIDWMPENPDDMSRIAEYYYSLIEARDRLAIQSKELNDDNLLSSDIYKNLETTVSKISDSVEVYTKKRYEELKLEYEFHNGIPTTVEGFNSMESAILSASGAGEKLQSVFKTLLAQDYSSLSVEATQNKDVVVESGFESVIFTEEQDKQIDNFQKRLSTLSSAINKVKEQKLTGSELLDLQQEFPDLIDTTDDLDVALANLVDDTLVRVVDFLQGAGASNGLINTFKQIASEAKGVEAVDWSSTFGVFDNADSEMQSLAGFVDSLGQEYTITASEARKFAEVFPELLSLGQVTSSGLIEFNKDVVESFVNSKQVEIQADRDAQIAQLESRKAILEGKQAAAQAALDLIAAQASGEIDSENQKNEKIAEARDNLVQHLVDLGVDEGNADAAVKELMAGNTQEYDRVVAEVSENVDTNLTESINDAAQNVNTQSRSMIDSLFGVASQAVNTAKSILSIGSDNPFEAIKEVIGGVTDAAINFSPSDVAGDFKRLVQEKIDIDRYQAVDTEVALELDIANYQKAIGDIDSQIALLKSGGEKSINDYLSDLGKGSQKSGNSKDKSKEPTEFDWMEQKIEVIESQVDKLKDKIDALVGYKGKNATTDTAIDLLIDKMEVLQQMYNRYMEEAEKVGLSQEYTEKIQNGMLDIESIDDENLVKQIKNYQDLYDKAISANDRIIETQKVVSDLNKSKLDNINNQFKQNLDITSQIIDTEKQLLDLREKSGDTIYADDYLSLGEKQLKITRQNLDAYNALAAEMSKQNLEKDSDEWKTYNDQLQEYKNNMISAAEATETYKDAMTNLVYKELDDFKSKMDSINGTISTMNSLIGDVDLIDDSGNLTDRGLAQVALYAQQLANSKQEAANYAEAIDSLEDALDSGLITQDEYNERLYNYTSAQESAVQSTKAAKDAMIALVKEGIQAQIDAKKKLTDETIAALEAEQDLHDYQNDINEKQKNITTLQKKIAALAGATSGTELATRLQLEQELLKAQEELYESQYDHNVEQQKNALNEAYDVYEQEKQDEMDELDSNLSAQEKAIEQYLNEVKNNYSTVYDILTQYGDSYSLSAIDDLTSPWESGSDAAYLCADAMGEAIANINYEISNIDMSPLYELIDALNSIGEYGMGGSSSQFEDVTNQGEWKKSSGRWWYGNSSSDYVSGGIYTIDGKQYGFGDDGYMLEGWNDDTGEWKYFEPGSGVMTRSAWKQDKKGDLYYLDKNGTMVTDSAVKAPTGEGYYYVNDDGMWDGENLSYDEVRNRGLILAYKNGTNRVSNDQLAWTQEEAPEIITRPSDSSMLVPLKAGDGVIEGDLTENLMKFAIDPARFIQQIPHQNMPGVTSQKSLQVSVNMPVNIEGNADEKTIGLMHDMMVDFTKNEMFNVIKKSGYKYRK